MKTKYQIGQWLTTVGRGEKLKMFVVGILIDICPGGVQTHYNCRTYLRDGFSRDQGWYPAAGKDGLELKRYNEVEVIPYVEPKEVEKK